MTKINGIVAYCNFKEFIHKNMLMAREYHHIHIFKKMKGQFIVKKEGYKYKLDFLKWVQSM